jgi:hypothetical protein
MVVAGILYVGTVALGKLHPHTGRNPINSLWSLSQWNPNGISVKGQCNKPLLPQTCLIEGVQTGTIQITRDCIAPGGVCIDYDGDNVKGSTIPDIGSCIIPYCGWSQCYITFGSTTSSQTYVQVIPADNGGFKLTGVSLQTPPTKFYMQRIAVNPGSGALVSDDNGTLCQFHLLPSDVQGYTGGQLLMLSYTNGQPIPQGAAEVTGDATLLSVTLANTQPAPLNIFLLVDFMPQSIAGQVVGPGNHIMSKKITVFGGNARLTNPSNSVLSSFTEHSQASIWNAITTNGPILIIEYANGYFYGSQSRTSYASALRSWSPISLLAQNVYETRLRNTDEPFYSWIT